MRRYRFVVLAIVLLALAAYLMHGKDAAKAESPVPDVHLPRYPTPDEYQRRVSRRTMMSDRPGAAAQGEPEPPRWRDPLLEVLPYDEHKGVVIVEASAIRFSELGERVLECLDREAKQDLDQLREETGIDVLDSIDRIGVSERTMVLTGNFKGLSLKEKVSSTYGDHGVIFGGEGEMRAALWNDELLVLSANQAQTEQMIDRLEGRAERAQPAFPDHMAYGEIYGWVPVDAISALIPDEGDRRIAERLKAAADKVELHVSVSGDVGMVARVTGKDASIRDLAKSIGGAMALGRTFASSKEEQDLAKILELARVVPRGDAFDVELALPSEVLLNRLGGECGARATTATTPEK